MFASANVMAAGAVKIGFVSVEKILTDAPQVKAVNDSMTKLGLFDGGGDQQIVSVSDQNLFDSSATEWT